MQEENTNPEPDSLKISIQNDTFILEFETFE